MLSQDLNNETYSNNICQRDTPDVVYIGLRLVPSRSALIELAKYGLTLEDCRNILENGYEPRKRAKNTIEKWLDYGSKTYNVVVGKDFDELMNEEVWVIIHIGMFTKKKKICRSCKNEMF